MILEEVEGVGGFAKRFCFPLEDGSKIEVLVNNPLANYDKFRFNIRNSCGYEKCFGLKCVESGFHALKVLTWCFIIYPA